MFGLDRYGFKRKRYADIRADIEASWRQEFGEDSRTSEKSINGILISIIAYALSPLWMLAEKVYNNRFIHKAEGVPLRNLTRNNLLPPLPAIKAVGFITATGDEGTVIEKGFLISSKKSEYITVEDAEIGEQRTVEIAIEAVNAGADGNAEIGMVNIIDTPTIGVDTVINEEVISGGKNEETDAELRIRHDLSLSGGGSPTSNGIRAEVLKVEGVASATVIENLTMDTVEGRPPRSIETYVLGGKSEEIVAAIFKRRAAGIQAYGEIVLDVTDDAGTIIPVGFTRVAEIEIYLEIELITSKEHPSTGDKQVRTELVKYIGGTDYDGNVYAGLAINQDVYFTKLIGVINNIVGIERVKTLKIGTTDSNLQDMVDIEINKTEIAITDYNKVVIL